jgi:RNA polymerase sigma-70 factor (ECF subfamily)
MDGRVHTLRTGPVSREEAPDLREELEGRLPEHSALAFRVAYGVLRQREDAEDVAQEALARAFRRLGALRDPERFRSWLVRSCWRAALDHRRARERRERRERASIASPPAPNPEEMAAASQLRERLLSAIDGLPEKLRVVVILCGLKEHDSREVASLLALPEGTVRSRLHAARRRLMEVLE